MDSAAQNQASAQRVGPSESPPRQAAWLAAGVFLAVVISTWVYVHRCALTSPWADELHWIPVVAGAQPIDAGWLTQAETGHCNPVVRLVYLAIGWAAGFDFRAMALANVVLLAAAALAMMLATARTRGHASALDVLFPVVLLNWSHYVNLLWGYQLDYVLPIALDCAILLLLAVDRPRLSIGRALAVSVCAASTALCGGAGLFFLPAVAAWLVYAGFQRLRADRTAGAVILVLALVSLAPLALWLRDLSPRHEAARSGQPAWIVTFRGALQFLSMSLGKFGGETHPAGGLIVLGLAVAAGAALARTWWSKPEERLRAAGFGFFLGGALVMALGAGLSRGAIGCLQTRYCLLGVR